MSVVSPAITRRDVVKNFKKGADDAEDKRKWWTSNGRHPNWIIPNAPDPVNGQLRFFDAVVQVVKA